MNTFLSTKRGNNGKPFIPVVLPQRNCSIRTGWNCWKHFKYYSINFKYLSRMSCSHIPISIPYTLNNSWEQPGTYSLERGFVFHTDHSCMPTVPHRQWTLLEGSCPTESLGIRGAPTALQNHISLQILRENCFPFADGEKVLVGQKEILQKAYGHPLINFSFKADWILNYTVR